MRFITRLILFYLLFGILNCSQEKSFSGSTQNSDLESSTKLSSQVLISFPLIKYSLPKDYWIHNKIDYQDHFFDIYQFINRYNDSIKIDFIDKLPKAILSIDDTLNLYHGLESWQNRTDKITKLDSIQNNSALQGLLINEIFNTDLGQDYIEASLKLQNLINTPETYPRKEISSEYINTVREGISSHLLNLHSKKNIDFDEFPIDSKFQIEQNIIQFTDEGDSFLLAWSEVNNQHIKSDVLDLYQGSNFLREDLFLYLNHYSILKEKILSYLKNNFTIKSYFKKNYAINSDTIYLEVITKNIIKEYGRKFYSGKARREFKKNIEDIKCFGFPSRKPRKRIVVYVKNKSDINDLLIFIIYHELAHFRKNTLSISGADQEDDADCNAVEQLLIEDKTKIKFLSLDIIGKSSKILDHYGMPARGFHRASKKRSTNIDKCKEDWINNNIK